MKIAMEETKMHEEIFKLTQKKRVRRINLVVGFAAFIIFSIIIIWYVWHSPISQLRKGIISTLVLLINFGFVWDLAFRQYVRLRGNTIYLNCSRWSWFPSRFRNKPVFSAVVDDGGRIVRLQARFEAAHIDSIHTQTIHPSKTTEDDVTNPSYLAEDEMRMVTIKLKEPALTYSRFLPQEQRTKFTLSVENPDLFVDAVKRMPGFDGDAR